MYTLSSWRSHLGSVGVYLLHQEPARTVRDPFTAYVPGEVTQVSGMTTYTLSSWRIHLGSVRVVFLNQEPVRTVKDPFTAYIPGEVTHVSRMTDVHPKILEKSPR